MYFKRSAHKNISCHHWYTRPIFSFVCEYLQWPECGQWFILYPCTVSSGSNVKRIWVLLCRKKKKKLLDALEISGKITLQVLGGEWMQGGRISSKPVNSRDMWHSQHLSPLFGVQREISHPDSRQHSCCLLLRGETKPPLPQALSVSINCICTVP